MLSFLLDYQPACRWKSQTAHFDVHHPITGIKFLIHFIGFWQINLLHFHPIPHTLADHIHYDHSQHIHRPSLFCSCILPLPSIRQHLIVWRIRGEIIRTVLCCIVQHNCAQSYAHWYEQFLNCFRIRFCVRACFVLLLAPVYLC